MLAHIKNLDFIEVKFKNKGKLLSQKGYCHQNCEEYVKRNQGTRHIIGWMEKIYSDGKKEYLLHSCIEENDSIIDITPTLRPKLHGKFALDNTISIRQEITEKFKFTSSKFGDLEESQHIISDY